MLKRGLSEGFSAGALSEGFSNMIAYNAMIVPRLSYRAESWVLTEREKQRVQAVEIRVLRKIAGVSKIDHMRNEVIREQLG